MLIFSVKELVAPTVSVVQAIEANLCRFNSTICSEEGNPGFCTAYKPSFYIECPRLTTSRYPLMTLVTLSHDEQSYHRAQPLRQVYHPYQLTQAARRGLVSIDERLYTSRQRQDGKISNVHEEDQHIFSEGDALSPPSLSLVSRRHDKSYPSSCLMR